MDYEPYDSSVAVVGTDDDFLPPHQNRMSRGGRISGNGRPANFGSVPYPRVYEETDMEAKIHQLEQEAYISILRAFKAQADAITWEKEGLITELRRELRLSNEEHRDLLSRVNADETIRKIREWRQSGGLQPAIRDTSQSVHDPIPRPYVSASRKKQKIAPSLPSQSFGAPSPGFRPQVMATANQPSSSAAKRGPTMGATGKKHKSVLAGASSMKMQYPSDPAGRGKIGNRISTGGLAAIGPAEGASFDPLIGRKVRTRWPDNNSFYEAVITNYIPDEGLHALVYDIGTSHETWVWVNLSEISPEDIQWDEGNGRPGHGLDWPVGRDIVPGAGRGRGLTKSQSRKDFPPSLNGIGKKARDDTQLLQTDTLIKEVERVFGASHPDPVEMEKAMKVLNEHEQALTDASADQARARMISMASTICPRAPRRHGCSNRLLQESGAATKVEWEARKNVVELLRTDLISTQRDSDKLNDRMSSLEDQVRLLVAGLSQGAPVQPQQTQSSAC